MARKALITGVSGQDGAYLARFLLGQGYVVTGTSRDPSAARLQNLERLGIRDQVTMESMAQNDFQSVVKVLRRVRPDEVYNLAGQSSVNLSFQQPVETLASIGTGVLNLLEAIRFLEHPTRLFSAGSSECYGDTGSLADESTLFCPRSPYAVAKATAFWLVANYREAYGIDACSGILFNHESPIRPERFVTQKIIAAACRIANGSEEKLHLGDMSISRDWGWAPEYVEAMWLMLQQDRLDDYVIATGETRSLTEFVDSSFACLGLDWKEHVRTAAALRRPSDIQMSRANPAKAMKNLGWSAKSRMCDVVRMMAADCMQCLQADALGGAR
ncbi:GDP-mannose 4,6-dehydratase [Accumulibacter sp.]|uniref:GDP-mannose 4,6-dehydratase n=1 Tax=Accumulibacter sp. TaxID=2053492 RepID=UPI00262C092A|nr:GDP-mannose 4,6-dehydratase [Accumulibacter sp.]